jgi:hypothetical protein
MIGTFGRWDLKPFWRTCKNSFGGFHTCQAIHRQLSGFGLPVDVVVANKEVLDKHKNNPGLIYQNILKEGKTII